MTTITDYYKYAQLATAVYVRTGGSLNVGDFVRAASAETANRLPLSLGQFLFDANVTFYGNRPTWTIRHYHGNDNPATPDASGFAASLFRLGDNGQQVLAIRGTEREEDAGVDLWQASLGAIGILGLSLPQAVSMVNLILRLRAETSDHAVPQLTVRTSLTRETERAVALSGTRETFNQYGEPVFEPVSVYLDFEVSYGASGLGLIAAGQKLAVTGHSLGGHLAVLAARLFPDLIDPDVVVFNAPGFDAALAASAPMPASQVLDTLAAGLGGGAAQYIDPTAHRLTEALIALFGDTGVVTPASTFQALQIHSIESEDLAPGDDLSLVASTLTHQQVLGGSTHVPTEPNSHVIEPLMDALALHALLHRIDGTLNFSTNESLLLAASPQMNRSEEALTEALFRLFVPDGQFLARRQETDSAPVYEADRLPTSDAIGPIDNFGWLGKGHIDARDAFHDAILRIGLELGGQTELRLENLTKLSRAQIASIAASTLEDNADPAYRYALAALNPFAVIGADYSMHNQTGELDLYDPVSGGGTLTLQWIADRAAFLAAKNDMYTHDRPFALGGYGGEILHFEDAALGHVVPVLVPYVGIEFPLPGMPRRVLFGGAGADSLVGAGEADRLYGGGGDDSLRGGRGNDYLEGGAGNDTYQFFSGDGHDTLLDIDGHGRIVYEGVVLTGGARSGTNVWISDDSKVTYRLIADGHEGGTLQIAIREPGGTGSTISVLNFRDGDLGIRLEGRNDLAPWSPEVAVHLVGDLEPLDADPQAPGVQLVFDAYGNFVRDPTLPSPGRADFLFGGPLNDFLDGRGGDDSLFGRGGDDHIDGGEGGDIIEGGDGDDVLIGGPDSDRIRGDAGSDWIYAEAMTTLEQALDESIAPTGIFSNWLSGGDGDDFLFGGAGDDNIIGDSTYFPTGPGWYWYETEFARIFGSVTGLYVDPDGEADIIHAGAGNDWVRGGLGDDLIFGDSGDDNLAGEEGADIIFGGDGNDFIAGDGDFVDPSLHGADYLDGGDGNDVIHGNGGDDTMLGGAGRDVLHGDDGDDYLDGGDGDDFLFGGAGNDTLYGGRGDDYLAGGSGADWLFGGEGNDSLHGEAGDDWLEGGAGDDVLFGGTGNDRVYGGDGDDLLIAGSGRDVLDGGAGNDVLRGGGGRDLYPFRTGDGVDRIAGDSGVNDIVFGDGIVSGSLQMKVLALRNQSGDPGSDQVLMIDYGAGDRINLEGGLRNAASLLHFSDGETLSVAQWIERAGGIEFAGDDEDNTLEAMTGNALVTPGGGLDLMIGGAGNTTYRFDGSSGWNYIFDFGGEDTIEFGHDIALEDLLFAYEDWGDYSPAFTLYTEGFELSLQIHRGGEGVIERYVFADGTAFSHEQLMARYGGLPALPPRVPVPGEIRQRSWVSIFEGTDGDDEIWDGDTGNVLYVPGKGNDTLYVFAGNNFGYLFREGDGHDVILGDDAGDETIYFDVGIAPESVRISYETTTLGGRVYEDMFIRYGTRGDVIEVSDGGGASAIERFWFADGRMFTLAELTAYINSLPGGPGSFVWTGTEGGDTFVSDMSVGGRIPFPIHDRVFGLGGDDTLATGAGNDYLDGGAGDDLLIGGPGSDTYAFGVGYGSDTIVETSDGESNRVEFGEGIAPAMLRVTREGDDLMLALRQSADTLTVTGWFSGAPSIDGFFFADGTAWDAGTILSLLEGAPPLKIELPPVSILEDEHSVVRLPADVFASGAVTVAATLVGGGALPAWLLFDSETLSFGASPDNDAVGVWSVSLHAVDGAGAGIVAILALTVLNVNDPPAVAAPLAPVDAVEDQPFAFFIPQATFLDVDVGDSLSLSVARADGAALPQWLAFDSAAGLLSGLPGDDDRDVALSVTASDSAGASVSTPLFVRVLNTPDAPRAGATIADRVALEDATFFLALPHDAFIDPDPGDVLAYDAALADGRPLPDWLAFDPVAFTLSGIPGNDDVGTYLVFLTATDLLGASATQSFRVTVENTNDAPQVTGEIARQTALRDRHFAYQLDRELFVDADPGDTEALAFSALRSDGSPLPHWLAFDPVSLTLSGTPDGQDAGGVRVRLVATDPSGESAWAEFDLCVIDANGAPVATVTLIEAVAYEDSVFAFAIPAGTFLDPDEGDVLVFAAAFADGAPLPGWLAFDPVAGVFSGLPANEDVGTLHLQVAASDLDGETASVPFELTILDVNDPPEYVGSLSDLRAIAGVAFEHRLPPDLFIDVDAGDEIALSVRGANDSPLPSWLAFDPASRVLSGAPPADAHGMVGLELFARDLRGAATVQGFAIAVSGVIAGTNGHDTIFGAAAGDLLSGRRGDDRLYGFGGNDVLAGEDGRDQLHGDEGNDLLFGMRGVDTLLGGVGNDLLIGGKDDDTLMLGRGNDVIAFNRGDGKDRVLLGEGGATISLGGGLAYRDMALVKDKNDLVLELAPGDRVVLADWYAGGAATPVTLQVIAESMKGFEPGGADPLMDNRIETFDFNALATQFDEARAAAPRTNKWKLMNGLLDAHLSGSDTEAIGGDLAYRYGLTGALSGIGFTRALDILGAADFGASAQPLHAVSDLHQGPVRLP